MLGAHLAIDFEFVGFGPEGAAVSLSVALSFWEGLFGAGPDGGWDAEDFAEAWVGFGSA
jgi:hypothetical protein